MNQPEILVLTHDALERLQEAMTIIDNGVNSNRGSLHPATTTLACIKATSKISEAMLSIGAIHHASLTSLSNSTDR